MDANLILPKLIRIGGGKIKEIQQVLNDLNVNKPFLITDTTMVKLGYVELLQKNLNQPIDTFSETEPEPTTKSINKGVEIFKQNKYDSIIALGGGSAIDSAKAIGFLGLKNGKMSDYKVPKIMNEQTIPIIAIPTTAGTGSETTNVTIISDVETSEKMLCIGSSFMPIATILDYELTMSMPKRVTADTGIDALSHAIEAYVSKKANFFSDTQALKAMNLIAKNLRKVYLNQSDKKAREEMILGSMLGGMSFCNASVALIHGMSRPIGVAFHVPHGMSNAMLFPIVVEYSLNEAEERYSDCAKAMGLTLPNDTNKIAANKLLKELKQLNIDLEVPTPEEFGINKKEFLNHIPIMAEQALASGSPNNNPKVPTKNEIINLYKKLWEEKI